MKLTTFSITVAAAAVFIVHTTFALPALPSTSLDPAFPSAEPTLTYVVAISQDAYNLSDHLLAKNASFPTNLTDGNDILMIEHCGDDDRTVERARNLARAAANVARVDAARGIDSTHGFTAVFKQDALKYQVSHFLNAIYAFHGVEGLKPYPAQATSPRLVCVQRNSATIYRSLNLPYDPWVRCHSRQTRHPSSRNVFYTFGNAFIFLCPDFLNQPLAPLGNHCPTVVDNVFVGDVNVFYRDYQMYQLMYQLIRFYLQRNALFGERFTWDQCVGMDAQSSARNPTNFLLYTACKLNLFFLCLISSFSTWT